MEHYKLDKLVIHLLKINENDLDKIEENGKKESDRLDIENTGDLFDMSSFREMVYVIKIDHNSSEIAAYNLYKSDIKGNVLKIGRIRINTYLNTFLDVHKSILYTNQVQLVAKILNQLNLRFKLSRIDIAYDAEHNYNPIIRLFNATKNPKYYSIVNRKEYFQKGNLILTPIIDGTIHETLYIPDKKEKAQTKLCLYNKYDDQIIKQCPITAEHLSNFKNPKKVYRFELRFNNIGKYSFINKLNINKLDDENYLKKNYLENIYNVIDIRLKDKHYLANKKSRSKKITIFSF